MEILVWNWGLFLCQFENFENMTHVYTSFAQNKGLSLYQEADFETHFSGTSPDRPLY